MTIISKKHLSTNLVEFLCYLFPETQKLGPGQKYNANTGTGSFNIQMKINCFRCRTKGFHSPYFNNKGYRYYFEIRKKNGPVPVNLIQQNNAIYQLRKIRYGTSGHGHLSQRGFGCQHYNTSRLGCIFFTLKWRPQLLTFCKKFTLLTFCKSFTAAFQCLFIFKQIKQSREVDVPVLIFLTNYRTLKAKALE
jgi:hypothetical protein